MITCQSLYFTFAIADSLYKTHCFNGPCDGTKHRSAKSNSDVCKFFITFDHFCLHCDSLLRNVRRVMLESPRTDKRTILKPQLKASEQVRLFLEQELLRANLRVGDRLPASRTLASHLGVSLTTVQNVLRDLAAQGIVRTEAGSGSYLQKSFATVSGKETLRIGLSFGISSPGEASGAWGSAISGAIIRAASLSARPISLHPVTVPNGPLPAVISALKSQDGRVDGMILHPISEGAKLSPREADLGYPIVHLNPGFTTASTNFVSSDFYAISHRIGRAWSETGRSRVLFVHNSGPEMNASAALRCAGLVAGLGNRIGNAVSLRIISGDSHSEEAGYELARASFRGRQALPDAIYLVGDLLAVGFCRYLAEQDISIPAQCSVISGGGVAEPKHPYRDLTRTQQPAERIGEALLEMAATLAEGDTAELPGRFIPCTFAGGQTTRATENQMLGLPEE